MRITIELKTLAVSSVASQLTRRKTSKVDVIFTRSGIQVENDPDAVGHVALTALGSLVAGGATTSWTKTGSGRTAVYSFFLDCNTTAVEALFASQTKPVSAVLTIDWTIDEVPFESAPVAVSINNANFTGDEGTPSEFPDLKASQAEAEAGTDNTKWMTSQRTAQAIAALSSADSRINYIQAAEPSSPLAYQTWLRIAQENSTFTNNCGLGLFVRNAANDAWLPCISPVRYYDNGNMAGFVTIGSDGVIALESFNYDGSPRSTLILGNGMQLWNGDFSINTGVLNLAGIALQNEGGVLKWNGSPVGSGGGSSSFILMNDSNLDSGWFSGVAGGRYAVDTTTAPAFAELPASPAVGDTIEFADAKGTWNTHGFTINRNGKKIEGLEVDYLDTAQGTQFFIVYIDDTTGWKIYESGTKPHILVAPTAPTGTAQVGSVLTADNGTWTGSPTSYLYQWKNSPDGTTWTNISGATSSTYTPQGGDIGLYVACEIIASNSNGNSLPVLSAATTPIAAVASALLLHFDGTEGSTAVTDSSTNNVPITVVGDAAISTSDSKFGGSSLYLPSEGSFLQFDDLAIGTGDFTIEGWCKMTDAGDQYAALIGNDRDDTSGFLIALNNSAPGGGDSALFAGTYIGSPAGNINDGLWHHLAAARSSGVTKFFIDGVCVATQSDAHDYTSGLQPTLIGNDGFYGSRQFIGYIDEIRILIGSCAYAEDFPPPTAPFTF